MGLFQTLSQQALAEKIASVHWSVIYAAPGMDQSVAKALATCAGRIGADKVIVVFDATANVARMGYGTFDVYDTLIAAGIEPRQEYGLRQSLLIVDNRGWAFTMRPQMLEQDVPAEEPAPNAIELQNGQVAVLRGEFPSGQQTSPDQSSNDTPPLAPTIGRETICEKQASGVKAELSRAPPQPFDLQRNVRVYTCFIRFVELRTAGWRIDRKKVRLPKTLPVFTTHNKKLNDRINSTLTLLDNIDTKKLSALQDEVRELRENFCKPVGGEDRVMLRTNQAKLEDRVAQIERSLAVAQKAATKDVEKALERVIKSLVRHLAKPVLKQKSDKFLGAYDDSLEGAKEFVRDELERTFPTAEQICHEMTISLAFKDVTYEMLSNQAFKDRVLTLFPQSSLPSGLKNEYLAARQRVDHQSGGRADAIKGASKRPKNQGSLF